MKIIKKFVSSYLILAIAFLMTGFYPHLVFAVGSLSSLSDTMSSQTVNVNSSHVIRFTVTSAVSTNGQKIIITFPSDFDFTSFVVGDITFTHGATTGLETNESSANLQDGAADGTHWGFAVSGTENRVMTLTAPTDGIGAAALAASDKVVITYASTHAVNASTSGSKTVTISTTLADGTTAQDTGSIAVAMIGGAGATETVTITATVDPTITFTNDDAAIGFGTLAVANARYATADASGSGADSVANTLVVATNAASGYTLTYSGPTLTKGGDTISVATIAGDADGTAGTEQFAISGALTGTGAMVADYEHATPNWKFVASTTTTLASHSGPVASDSIAMHYLANIAADTQAGSYSTAVTYLATGNF